MGVRASLAICLEARLLRGRASRRPSLISVGSGFLLLALEPGRGRARRGVVQLEGARIPLHRKSTPTWLAVWLVELLVMDSRRTMTGAGRRAPRRSLKSRRCRNSCLFLRSARPSPSAARLRRCRSRLPRRVCKCSINSNPPPPPPFLNCHLPLRPP